MRSAWLVPICLLVAAGCGAQKSASPPTGDTQAPAFAKGVADPGFSPEPTSEGRQVLGWVAFAPGGKRYGSERFISDGYYVMVIRCQGDGKVESLVYRQGQAVDATYSVDCADPDPVVSPVDPSGYTPEHTRQRKLGQALRLQVLAPKDAWTLVSIEHLTASEKAALAH
jgi:hypothetical protein